MGNFVSGNTPLPPAKQDAYPPTGLATELDASDINDLWSAAGDLRDQAVPADWAKAALPLLMAHRGSFNIGAPENTFASWDLACAYGPDIGLETDVQMTADGALVHMHDPSPDRTCGTSGNVTISNLTLADLRAQDASLLYNPSGQFTGTRIPTFEEYLRKYGNRRLLIPEVKDERSTTGTAMANLIVRYRLQRNTVVTCFSQNALNAVKAVDSSIRTSFVSGTQVAPAAAVASGSWAVTVDKANVDAAYVASIHAVGIKVIVYTAIAVWPLEKMINVAGVDGVMCDDPSLLPMINAFTPRSTAPSKPTIAVPYGPVSAAWRPRFSTGGWSTVVSGGFLTWTGFGNVSAGAFTALTIPGIRPSAALATSQTIHTTLKAVATPTVPDTSRWLGFRLCFNSDDAVDWNTNADHDTNGYVWAYRQNGTSEIGKIVNEVYTQLATATWNTYAAAATFPITIAITATTITITRTDTVQTLVMTDSTFPRTGWVTCVGSGVVPGIGQTDLTY